MGGCDGVVETGGGGGPGGFPVVVCRGGARGVGARADVDSRVCAHGLRLGLGEDSWWRRYRGMCCMWADIEGW